MIGLLTNLRKTLEIETLRSLYFAFIHSYLINGITVWGSAAKVHINPLVKHQKKAIRIISSSSYLAPTREFKDSSILPIKFLYYSGIAIFMYKVHHELHPHIIQHFFEKNLHLNARQKYHYKMPHTVCKVYEISIMIQGPKLYNQLTNMLDINCSLFTYKKHLKDYFIKQV